MRETFMISDVLNVLISLESKGAENYRQMAELSEDSRLSTLFEALAAREIEHKHIYEHFRNALEFEAVDVMAYTEYAEALLESQIQFLSAEVPMDFEKGFWMAVQLEKDTIFFLTHLRDLVSSQYQSQVDPLIQEEKGHLVRLMAERK